LVVDGGIIEISSQQKEDQHRTHDIIIEDWEYKDARKDDRESQVP
jgi:hypothetical protein